MMTLWYGFGPETKAALIGVVGTFFVALVGFGGLIFQLRSQGLQSREAIAENERRKIKADMYEDAVSISRELADSAIELSSQLRDMAMQVGIAANASSVNIGYPIPSARFPALMSAYNLFSDAALRFIFLVEHRRFIDPRLLIFRTALSVVLHDTRGLMFSRFVESVMPALPTDGPDGKIFPYTPPSLNQAEAVRVLSYVFIRSLDDAVSYTEDFLVELQNRLLGDLFGNSIPHREPIDPNSRVITLDQVDELERWFAATPWGQNNTRILAETLERLGK